MPKPNDVLSIALADEEALELKPRFIATGIAGVLAGWLILARTVTGSHPRRNAVLALTGYSALALIVAVLFIDHWLLKHQWALILIALTASACGSLVQVLLSASVQERLPDNARESVTGVMFAIRQIKIFRRHCLHLVGNLQLHRPCLPAGTWGTARDRTAGAARLKVPRSNG